MQRNGLSGKEKQATTARMEVLQFCQPAPKYGH
jgi:hypothetical protein